MKATILKSLFLGVFFMMASLFANAQSLQGGWWYDNQLGVEVTLNATAKKGNNIHLPDEVCNGYIAVSEYYEYFMMLNLKLQKKVSSKEFIYTAWGTDERSKTKKCKGTVTARVVGNRLLLTGKDSKGKKWPFDGLYLEGSN